MLHLVKMQPVFLAACALAKALRTSADPTPARNALQEALGISARTADRTWAYARAWLLKKMQAG